jgi:hypothetical protein
MGFVSHLKFKAFSNHRNLMILYFKIYFELEV